MLPTFSTFLMLLGLSPAMEASHRPADPCCEPQQVCLEVRLIQVTPTMAERYLQRDSGGPLLLSELRLVDALTEMQGDRRTEIMQAPKLCTYDGQTGTVEVGQLCPFVLNNDGHSAHGFIGTRLNACATITGDRKSVLVEMKFEHSEPLDTTESSARGVPHLARTRMESKVTIPDGQTLVLAAGPVEVEKRVEYTPPVLSKIPYLSRMFKTVGYGREARQLLVMVTPKILKNSTVAVMSAEAPRRLPELRSDETLPLNGVELMSYRVAATEVIERQSTAVPEVRLPWMTTAPEPLKYDVSFDRMTLGATYPMGNAGVRVDNVLPDNLSMWPKPWIAKVRVATDSPTTESVSAKAEPDCCVRACAHIKAIPATATLTVADVERLSAEGVSDEVVINQIRTTGSTFTLTAQDLVRLSKMRISDSVIVAMQNAKPAPVNLMPVMPAGGLGGDR